MAVENSAMATTVSKCVKFVEDFHLELVAQCIKCNLKSPSTSVTFDTFKTYTNIVRRSARKSEHWDFCLTISDLSQLNTFLEAVKKKTGVVVDEHYVDDIHTLFIKLERTKFCERVIESILTWTKHSSRFRDKHIALKCEDMLDEAAERCTLTTINELRLLLWKQIALNIARYIGMSMDESNATLPTILTNRSQTKVSEGQLHAVTVTKPIVFACVVDAGTQQKTNVTCHEYYRLRSCQITQQAGNNDGATRHTSSSDETDHFVHAVVVNDLMENHQRKTVVIGGDVQPDKTKEIAFVLYNYARINKILERFAHHYPHEGVAFKNGHASDVDLALLSEELRLLRNYMAPFKHFLFSCIKDFEQGSLKCHQLLHFVKDLARAFSSYYTSTRVLKLDETNQQATMFARVYFLTALGKIFGDAITLLTINPLAISKDADVGQTSGISCTLREDVTPVN